MQIKDISLPEIYKESADFRFFCKWFEVALSRIKYDTENLVDLYDPLRCPEDLLWMLGDTVGYKYDDRLPTAFNRLVILYFMSMIRNKGSKDGVMLAAEVNLAQFNILMKAGKGYTDDAGNQVPPNDVLYNRLEDTLVPVNSAYVTPHTAEGYIDVVYFSTEAPIDACIEYVRPLGMYVFQHPGVRYDGRTKISVDARLTNQNDIGMSFGPTHVGHYSREDYARLQKGSVEPVDVSGTGTQFGSVIRPDTTHTRREVYQRNRTYEGSPDASLNPGYRALYSLQLSNSDHIVSSLIEPIFSIGYGPQDVDVVYEDDYIAAPYQDKYANRPHVMDKPWNLRYNKAAEEALGTDISTIDDNRSPDIMTPRPAVNLPMTQLGDAISLNSHNTQYLVIDNEGNPVVKDVE